MHSSLKHSLLAMAAAAGIGTGTSCGSGAAETPQATPSNEATSGGERISGPRAGGEGGCHANLAAQQRAKQAKKAKEAKKEATAEDEHEAASGEGSCGEGSCS